MTSNSLFRAGLAHEKVGHTAQGLWHHKNMQLPALDAYYQHVANDLIQAGHPESEAVHMAVGIVEKWARGGGGVTAETQAKAAAAVAEWERLRAQAKGSTAKRASMTELADRAAISTADVNNLPDSDFAYIEPGGKKDSSGRTVPRSLRHFPIPDAAHVRAALARIGQDAEFGQQALPKVRAKAKALGIDVGGGDSGGSASRGEILRMYPLEDCRIVTRAAGDGTGTLVEAYATVFDEPAEIHDHQGHYRETIDRHAFDAVLDRIRRSRGGFASHVKVLYNHGKTASGADAPEFQVPLGVPEEITPERRGLLTRTRYDAGDPFTERILAKVRSGAINAQSFVGAIMRSDPALMGPGDRYRRRGGALVTVRRMQLGLREYGPVLWPAYSGAEILGVRMQLPGGDGLERYGEDAPEPGSPGDDEYGLLQDAQDADLELAVAGASPAAEDTSRYHQHALYRIRSAEIRERIGLDWDE